MVSICIRRTHLSAFIKIYEQDKITLQRWTTCYNTTATEQTQKCDTHKNQTQFWVFSLLIQQVKFRSNQTSKNYLVLGWAHQNYIFEKLIQKWEYLRKPRPSACLSKESECLEVPTYTSCQVLVQFKCLKSILYLKQSTFKTSDILDQEILHTLEIQGSCSPVQWI